jgi:DNA-directed RNA polymerase subunit K/omega
MADLEEPVIPTVAGTNRFHFVVVSSLRAQQLLAGSTPRVDAGHNVTTTAQMEVAEGRIVQTAAGEAITPAQCHWQL